MPAHVPLNARRRRLNHRRTVAFRAARVDAHEDLGDWFLGPRPEDHEEDEDWRRRTSPAVDPVGMALDAVLCNVLELRLRVRWPDGLPPLLPRPASPAQPAPDDDSPPAVDVAALEQHAAAWAQALLAVPQSLVWALADDPEQLAAFRDQTTRLLGGAGFAGQHRQGIAPNTWRRILVLAALSYPMWLRPLSTWQGGSQASLLQHLLQDFEPPPVLWPWLMGTRLGFAPDLWRDADLAMQHRPYQCLPLVWWVARTGGCSVHRLLRAVGHPAWALSAADLRAVESLTPQNPPCCDWRQLRAQAELQRLGGSARDWQRCSGGPGDGVADDATLFERLGHWPLPGQANRIFDDDHEQGPLPEAPLRATMRWLVQHSRAISDAEARAMLHWALLMMDLGEAPGRTPFSWAGRTPRSVLPPALALQDRLRRAQADQHVDWPSQGWDRSIDCPEQPGVLWQMRELTSSTKLSAEGASQRHCVGSYAHHCAMGATAIFQLSLAGRRHLTLEVDLQRALVVQARGRANSKPEPLAADVVRQWANSVGLAVAGWAM